MSDELFPQPVPIVVLTGEYESGKTLAILTTGYPIERVLLYDLEISSETYHGEGAKWTRVDPISQLSEGWNNLQLYEAWAKHVRTIQPGQYDVIGIDPIERIEAGITDWTQRHPEFFGHSANQYQRMSGLMWGDVKDLWARHILDLKSKCRMVILTAHMRNIYLDNKPTGQRERKGKETLSELATLELELTRVIKGKKQALPAAKVLKSRLLYGDLSDPTTIRPMFDPWINPFSWAIVRDYMNHGADPDNLKTEPGPSPEEKEMEKLRLQATIAQAHLAGMDSPSITGSNGAMTGAEFTAYVEKQGWSMDEAKARLLEKFGPGYKDDLAPQYIAFLTDFYAATGGNA